jgi:hypothetical protein
MLLHRIASLALLLGGCGGSDVTKVDANISGDAGKYQGFRVCVEISYQNTKSLAVVPKDLCSSETVMGNFQVRVTDKAFTGDVYNSSGKVFLQINPPVPGTVTSRDEKIDGETALLSINVKF